MRHPLRCRTCGYQRRRVWPPGGGQTSNITCRNDICGAGKPQDVHSNWLREGRLFLSAFPHSRQAIEVLRGLTTTTITPVNRTLYSINRRSWSNAQECRSRRRGREAVCRPRMHCRFSNAMPRPVSLAHATNPLGNGVVRGSRKVMRPSRHPLQHAANGFWAFFLIGVGFQPFSAISLPDVFAVL